MSRILARLVAVAATGLAFTDPLSATPAQADIDISSLLTSDPLANPTLSLEEFEVQLMKRINEVRTSSGRRKIARVDSCVDRMAETWADRIATTGELVHRDQRRVTRQCDQRWAGEDLIRGEMLTPRTAVEAWLASPAHREILLKRRARLAGVAVARDARGRYVGVLNVSDPG